MPTVIDATKAVYDTRTSVFHFSEKDTVQFDTEYIVRNPRTGGEMSFEFSHSTGPEFEPDTVWVYKSDNHIKLVIHNDAAMARHCGDLYLKAKLG